MLRGITRMHAQLAQHRLELLVQLLPGHLVFGVYLSVRLPAPSTVSWVDAGQG